MTAPTPRHTKQGHGSIVQILGAIANARRKLKGEHNGS